MIIFYGRIDMASIALIAFAFQLLPLLATTSAQSCPVSGQSRIECASPSTCQQTCANANTPIPCLAVCIVNGCECPSGMFIDNETNSCVQPVGCAKIWCGLPRDPGNCGFNVSSEVRYFFDATSGQCQQFEYEGCSGNGNNFESMQECRETCREVSTATPETPSATVMPQWWMVPTLLLSAAALQVPTM